MKMIRWIIGLALFTLCVPERRVAGYGLRMVK
jgi:hypothetical protein